MIPALLSGSMKSTTTGPAFRHQIPFRAIYASLVATCVSGCFLVAETPTPQPVDSLVHTVKHPGETLGVLSSWYTGTPRHWREIQASNPTLDPRRIKIGNTIHIPRHLIRNQATLTAPAIAAIEQQIAGIPGPNDLAWRDAEETTYAYPVTKIPGCTDLSDSLAGLRQCADRVGQQVRVTPTSQKAPAPVLSPDPSL